MGLAFAGLVCLGCWTDTLAPDDAPTGRFAVVAAIAGTPAFAIVPVAELRVQVRRAVGEVVLDTAVAVAENGDSVALDFRIPIEATTPGSPATELFELGAALTGPDGDTLFIAGPDTVQAVADGTVTPVVSTLTYVGVGAEATSVRIDTPPAFVDLGDTISLSASALDAAAGAIPGTPIEWLSLDPGMLSVIRPDSGRVVADGGSGQARVVARLLTGQADTVTLAVNVLQPDQLCSPATSTAAVSFADAGLDGAVRSTLGLGLQDALTCAAVSTIPTLDAGNLGIADLTGIQNLTSVSTLDLRNNEITDVSSLAGLTSLTRVWLVSNQIEDVSPLSGLTELTLLSLASNRISDLTPLGGLMALASLSLGSNAVSDITPLGSLTSLSVLGLSNNQVSDLQPLASLTDLGVLHLTGNQVTSLDALSGLTGLFTLRLSENQISDVTPLAGLTSLQILALASNPNLVDIQALIDNAGLGSGDRVDLTGTGVPCPAVEALRAGGATVDSECIPSVAYVTRGGTSDVAVVDPEGRLVTATIPIGGPPQAVAFSVDGATAFVGDVGSDAVTVIDVVSGAVTTTIPVFGPVRDLAVAPSGGELYVAVETSNLVRIVDVASNTVVDQVSVGSLPYALSFTPDGTRALVVNIGSDDVSVIDVASRTVAATIPVGDTPLGVAVLPDGTRAYVTVQNTQSVEVIDIASASVVASIPVPATPRPIAAAPSGAAIYVGNSNVTGVTWVIDPATNTIQNTIDLGAGPPWSIAFAPGGSEAWIATFEDGAISVIDVATETVVGTIAVGDSPISIDFNRPPS